MVFNALHDQRTGRRTIGHVIKVSVYTHHRRIIGNIQVGLLRVRVPCLSRIHLILHPCHAPRSTHVVLIVGVNAHIAAGNIRRSDIVHQCLTILGCSAAKGLSHAGSQRGCFAGVDGIVVVAGLIGDPAGQLIQVIGKGIAAGGTQIINIRQATAGFQRSDSGIALISTEYCGANLLLGTDTGKTVTQQELCPEFVRQIAVEVAAHHGADRLAAGEILHKVIGVQIAVQIQNTKAMDIIVLRRIVIAQMLAVGAQLIGHVFYGSGGNGTILFCIVNKVTDITAPAAKVAVGHSGRGIGLHGVIGDVHAAEHMDKVYLIPVWQGKLRQTAQRPSRSAVSGILITYILGKFDLFFTSQHGPAAAGILFHAAADVVDDQPRGILAHMLTGIRLCVALQHLQGCQKSTVIIDRYRSCRRFTQYRQIITRRDILGLLRLLQSIIFSRSAALHGLLIGQGALSR